MDTAQNKKTFDHDKASVADKILIIGELEHIRRHALRSAVSTYNEDEPDVKTWVSYVSYAIRAKALRRLYQSKYFGALDDPDWCLCKAAASLRQLAYETCEGDVGMLQMIDELVDDIWGESIGQDLSDCVACREDREVESNTPYADIGAKTLASLSK